MALPTPSREPTLGLMISNAILAKLLDVHTMLPARVERYDSVNHLVDVKPLLKTVHLDAEGERIAGSIQVIPNVPLLFFGAGGVRITVPVSVGDTVMLVFCEASLDTWKERGIEVEPGDDRRHNFTDAVAIPGLRSKAGAWKGADSSAVTIGTDGGPFEGAALGATLKTFLDGLKVWLDAHIHPTAVGPSSPSVPPSPSVPAVASSTVKISS